MIVTLALSFMFIDIIILMLVSFKLKIENDSLKRINNILEKENEQVLSYYK